MRRRGNAYSQCCLDEHIDLCYWMGRWSFTVATNVISIDKAVIWMLAGAVSFTQLIWLLFISRSFRVRQLLFVRQRQIESHLGITKSISIDLFDESANVKDGVEKFLSDSKKYKPGNLERCILCLFAIIPLWNMQRAGRGALYTLSFTIWALWISFASWNQFVG